VSLSSHVLDSMLGTPAKGVSVRWERLVDDAWKQVGKAVTDDDGRVDRWVAELGVAEMGVAESTGVGVHRLLFGSGGYFFARGVSTFYPEVVVVFEVVDEAAHHHVPLLLSPFAYSTYRGS